MIHRASGDDNIVIDAAATDGRSRTGFRATTAAAVTTKSITSTYIFYSNNTTAKTEN